jgi:hypothetical protein
MIKIEKIDKEKDNYYFIVYKLNNEVRTCNGTAKEVLNFLAKDIEEINDK